MSVRVPTAEQRRAIEATAAEVLVEAGAGTGKTGVMVDRYCRLVCEQEIPLDSILAFTFTDKAAAELRQRIRADLARRAAEGCQRAAELHSSVGGAWVTTIHGFCNRLLSAHPVAVGVDPRFRVLDAPETERTAREAFDEALAAFLAGGGRDREETLAAYDVGGLRGMVVAAHAELRSRGVAEPEPSPAWRRPRGRRAASPERRRGRARRAQAGQRQPRAARAGDLGLRRARRGDRPRRGRRAALHEHGKADGRLPGGRRGGDRRDRRRNRGRPRLRARPRAAPALLRALRGRQAEAGGGRLRGPADLRRPAAGAQRNRRRLPRPLRTHPRRRVPGHQPAAAAIDRGPARPGHSVDGGGRRAAVDLRVPARRPRGLPRAARRDRSRSRRGKRSR